MEIKENNYIVIQGFIVKKENYINGVKFCEYYSTKFNGGVKWQYLK